MQGSWAVRQVQEGWGTTVGGQGCWLGSGAYTAAGSRQVVRGWTLVG